MDYNGNSAPMNSYNTMSEENDHLVSTKLSHPNSNSLPGAAESEQVTSASDQSQAENHGEPEIVSQVPAMQSQNTPQRSRRRTPVQTRIQPRPQNYMSYRVSVQDLEGDCNGTIVLVLPGTLDDLLMMISSRFSYKNKYCRLYTRYGAIIEDITILKDEDLLFSADGGEFPHAMRMAQMPGLGSLSRSETMANGSQSAALERYDIWSVSSAPLRAAHACPDCSITLAETLLHDFQVRALVCPCVHVRVFVRLCVTDEMVVDGCVWVHVCTAHRMSLRVVAAYRTEWCRLKRAQLHASSVTVRMMRL